jgi:bifunctional non-homologous end joining protein LigD
VYAFDLLKLNGEDLRGFQLIERKKRLLKLVRRSSGIEYAEHLQGHGLTVFEHACGLGLEGIVSKRIDLPYRAGRTNLAQDEEQGLSSNATRPDDLHPVSLTPA